MKKYALLVGVNQYKDPGITPLAYASADVQGVAERLKSVCRFDQVTVFGSQTDNVPSLKRVTDALDAMAEEIQHEDLFLFFFSGHGNEVDGETYLTTYGTRQASLSGGLSLKVLQKKFTRLDAGHRLLLVDACRTKRPAAYGKADSRMSDGMSRNIVAVAQARTRVDRAININISTAMLLACQKGQSAYECHTKGHGIFTHFLLEGLDGKAWVGQELDFKQLAGYTQREVSRWSRDNNQCSTPQDPWYQEFGAAAPIIVARRGSSCDQPAPRVQAQPEKTATPTFAAGAQPLS